MIPAPPDPPELDRVLWAGFPKTDVAFDIGANAGQTFSKILEFANEIVAFEPYPESVEYLRATFGASLPQVTIFPLAISSHDGELELLAAPSKTETGQLVSANIPGMEWSMDASENGEAFAVEAITLDTFCRPSDSRPDDIVPGFIKIDVEGHELEVLLGGKRVIETYKPHMLIEVHSEHLGDAIVNLLFDIYSLDVVRHPHYDAGTLLWRSHFWLRCFPKH